MGSPALHKIDHDIDGLFEKERRQYFAGKTILEIFWMGVKDDLFSLALYFLIFTLPREQMCPYTDNPAVLSSQRVEDEHGSRFSCRPPASLIQDWGKQPSSHWVDPLPLPAHLAS